MSIRLVASNGVSRETRLQNKAKAIGKLTFVKYEMKSEFRCSLCKGKGKHALIFTTPAADGKGKKEILLGATCLKRFPDLDLDKIQQKIDLQV